MKRPTDVVRATQAIRDFVEALGYDGESDELRDTPARVVDAYVKDLICGEDIDVEQLVREGSVPTTSHSLVVVSDIAVSTLCPHHLLPAFGQAIVAYVPGDLLLGLGTVAALVNAHGRRLTLQERLTEDVVRTLMTVAGARGAYCSIRLEHACLRLRGQRQVSAIVSTSLRDGCLLESARYQEISSLLEEQV